MRVKPLFFFILLLSFAAVAQDNSPYTRFGVGALSQSIPASLRGMGIAVADQDGSRFNLLNPASLAQVHFSVLQAGAGGHVTWLQSQGNKTETFGNATADYLMLAFQVPYRHWGWSLGLAPRARMNYSVAQLNSAATGIPESINQFDGKGSLYDAFVASGWSFGHLSMGVEAAYTFGNLTRSSRLVFDDTLNGFNTRFNEERTVHGLTWNAGLQYDLIIRDTSRMHRKLNHILFGLSGHAALAVPTTRDYLYERYVYELNQVELPYDTLASRFNEKGNVVLPAEVHAGIVYKHMAQNDPTVMRWQLGVEGAYTVNDAYRSFGEHDSLVNQYRLSIGGEWVPHAEAVEGYFNTVHYRTGLHYGNSPVKLHNTDMTDYGATIGLGFPVRASRGLISFVDAAVDFGSHGTLTNSLLREHYIRASVGFSFADHWFIPHRYD